MKRRAALLLVIAMVPLVAGQITLDGDLETFNGEFIGEGVWYTIQEQEGAFQAGSTYQLTSNSGVERNYRIDLASDRIVEGGNPWVYVLDISVSLTPNAGCGDFLTFDNAGDTDSKGFLQIRYLSGNIRVEGGAGGLAAFPGTTTFSDTITVTYPGTGVNHYYNFTNNPTKNFVGDGTNFYLFQKAGINHKANLEASCAPGATFDLDNVIWDDGTGRVTTIGEVPEVTPEEFGGGLETFLASINFVSTESQFLFAIILVGLTTIAGAGLTRWVASSRFKNYFIMGMKIAVAIFCVFAAFVQQWILVVLIVLSVTAAHGAQAVRNTWSEVRTAVERDRQTPMMVADSPMEPPPQPTTPAGPDASTSPSQQPEPAPRPDTPATPTAQEDQDGGDSA